MFGDRFIRVVKFYDIVLVNFSYFYLFVIMFFIIGLFEGIYYGVCFFISSVSWDVCGKFSMYGIFLEGGWRCSGFLCLL